MKHLNTNEFRESIMRSFKDMKVPVMGTFEITGRCNFDCKMCYVHTKSNAEYIHTERSGDWWISIMEEACNRGMLFALITGGECLLHPDFFRIYSFLRSKGVYTSINTNGFLLNQEVIDFLKKDPPFELQITLYGTDDKSYFLVTGARAFSQVRDGILRARKAGLNLKVAVTPNTFAPGETTRIVKFLKEQSISMKISSALHTSYDNNANQALSDYQVDVDEKIRYLLMLSETPPQPIAIENLPPAGGGKTETLSGMRCSGGKTAFFITHDASMLPCPTAHDICVPIEEPGLFGSAWDSIQKATAKFSQPVECEGCPYRKACLACPLLRCGKAGEGHCDPKVCEETKRLVAAGVKKLPNLE